MKRPGEMEGHTVGTWKHGVNLMSLWRRIGCKEDDNQRDFTRMGKIMDLKWWELDEMARRDGEET